MTLIHIPDLCAGDRVQADFLVTERSEKKTKAGDAFVTLTLGNSSGSIETAPIWSNNLTWADGAERGTVVGVVGQVTFYGSGATAKRQLNVSAPLRIVASSLVDVNAFLPSVGDCTRLWAHVDRMRAEMGSATLRRIVDIFYSDDQFRLRLERTPGSVAGHHAKLGGLLQHIVEVAMIARATAKTCRANIDLVTSGVLLHDIGKVESYSVSTGGFSYTPCGHLIGHVVLGCMMLDRAISAGDTRSCSDQQLMDLQHIILAHHGSLEFGSPVQPMTLEAEIVHWADEASAKSNDMLESLEDRDSFNGDDEISSRRPWRVGRRIWRRPHGWE
ncbi:MAG: HD domain-containing protein [Gemmatimonadota bacterium]|nr:HD domain-containing protein [Gemmatimonadota bacterium]